MTSEMIHDETMNDAEIEAVEGFMVDVQVYLNEIMDAKKISRAELARRMGVSRARVSQMFTDDSNLTIRMLARAAFHLGEEPRVESEATQALREERRARREKAAVKAAPNVHSLWTDISDDNLVDAVCADDDGRIAGLLASAGARR